MIAGSFNRGYSILAFRWLCGVHPYKTGTTEYFFRSPQMQLCGVMYLDPLFGHFTEQFDASVLTSSPMKASQQ